MDSATVDWLRDLDLRMGSTSPESSAATFDDGGKYQVEIPEVENAEVFREAVEAAERRGISLHRISQGSGITRLADNDLREIAQIGAANSIEVYLFMGVRGENGLGYQSRSPGGGSTTKRLQGSRQFAFALHDVRRALNAGIRGFLISDEGLLMSLNALRTQGVIPSDVALKTSVSMGHGTAAAARLMEQLGAESFNLPVDLDLESLCDIRKATGIQLDQYIEAPALLGGGQRYYELAEIVQVCAPVNLKFGLSTEELTDPVGVHSESTARIQVRERVRLAALGLELLENQGLKGSMADAGRRRRGLPQVSPGDEVEPVVSKDAGEP